LLYELISGYRPYQLTTGSPHEVATAVCEQDPERPSVRARRRELAGDLDSIVLMAMRKEPSRRYASADMLRQDLERHLNGAPVLAHRGSWNYRVEKFVRRHVVEVSAVVLVVAALLAGLSVAVTQSRTASRERDRAEQALAESEGVTNFLMGLFGSGDAGDPPAPQLSAVDLLQRGAARAHQLSNQPIVHARLLDVIGQMSLQLGRYSDAQRWLEQAVSIRRASLGPNSLELSASLIHLARVYRNGIDVARARELTREALAIRQRVLPANHPDIAEALYEFAWGIGGTIQERLQRLALDILPDTGAIAERRVTVLQSLSTNLRRQGRMDEAVATDREAVNVAERVFGPEHHITAYAMIHLGDHVRDIEQNTDEAERLFRRGLAVLSKQLGEQNLRLLHGLNSLGSLLSGRGDAEAEQVFRRALALRESATGPDHPAIADQLQLVAQELTRQRRLAEAEALMRQALSHSQKTLGPRHATVINARMPQLAEILHLQGRRSEAEQLYQTALEQNQSGDVMVGQMKRAYGRLLLRQGDHTRAEAQLLQSLALLERSYPDRPDHPNVHESKRALMELYSTWGKVELVERYRVPPGRWVSH
jgi:serine/threonine-protein kinase